MTNTTEASPSPLAPEIDVAPASSPSPSGGVDPVSGPGPSVAVPSVAAPSVAVPASSGDATRTPARSIDLLHGVEMTVTVELGRTKLLLRDLLALRSGSIVELDRPAGSLVDVLVNDTLLAHGEVVVVDDEFGVRITDIVSTATQPGPG